MRSIPAPLCLRARVCQTSPMDPVLLTSLAAIVSYAFAAGLLLSRIGAGEGAYSRGRFLFLLVAGTLLHAWALGQTLPVANGLRLGFFQAASLVGWFTAVLLLLGMARRPVEALGLFILPLAIIALIANLVAGDNRVILTDAAPALKMHVLLSILAYSALTLATFQAVLMTAQERRLRRHHMGTMERFLPPMETMETLLFQIIVVGFLLLTVSLATGFLYLEDMFAQHLAHKTILAIVAWAVFGGLLFGRWRYGWRGRTALRWTLSGFVLLMLAYFGSKFVLELLLSP